MVNWQVLGFNVRLHLPTLWAKFVSSSWPLVYAMYPRGTVSMWHYQRSCGLGQMSAEPSQLIWIVGSYKNLRTPKYVSAAVPHMCTCMIVPQDSCEYEGSSKNRRIRPAGAACFYSWLDTSNEGLTCNHACIDNFYAQIPNCCYLLFVPIKLESTD